MQKSDKLLKFALFKILKIGLSEKLEIHTKKAPITVHYQKWCRWQACARGQSHRANQRFSLRSLSFAKLRLALSPDLLMPPQVRLCNITIKKTSAMGGFFNGARYYAIIGLIFMMNSNNFAIKLKHFMTLIPVS